MIGIDEVGRGSWAGPLLVVAARQRGKLPPGLADSKTLSRHERERMFGMLNIHFAFGEGWVQADEIDSVGMAEAMRIGVNRALVALGAAHDDIIVMDGSVNYCGEEFTNVQTIVKADQSHPIVSAASIFAKVTRDRHMERASQFYPYYGFEKHVGYGTALHQSALKIHGVSAIHRKSFKPVQEFLSV
jgi:ribonuclease HII